MNKLDAIQASYWADELERMAVALASSLSDSQKYLIQRVGSAGVQDDWLDIAEFESFRLALTWAFWVRRIIDEADAIQQEDGKLRRSAREGDYEYTPTVFLGGTPPWREIRQTAKNQVHLCHCIEYHNGTVELDVRQSLPLWNLCGFLIHADAFKFDTMAGEDGIRFQSDDMKKSNPAWYGFVTVRQIREISAHLATALRGNGEH